MPKELLFAWASSGFIALGSLYLTFQPLKRRPKKDSNQRFPRRWGAFLRRLPWMLVAVLVSILFTGVVFGLRGYRAFVREDVVGILEIVRAGDDDPFVAIFTQKEKELKKIPLSGSQVQVDAKVLKWTPAMNFLGLHTNYELDRIVGRQTEVDDANSHLSKAVSLSEERAVDLFKVARLVSWITPVVDASYGSSSFVSARDGERWELLISTSGLLFRPLPPH